MIDSAINTGSTAGCGSARTIEPWDCDSDLQVIHVRLTDSFLSCLEQLTAQSEKATIYIKCESETSGVFMMNSNNSNSDSKEFKFSCKQISNKRELRPNLLCIKSKPSLNHFDLGELSTCLQIHANDEVFESTKDKMNAIEANKNKLKAKELQPFFNKKFCNKSKTIINSKSTKSLIGKDRSTYPKRTNDTHLYSTSQKGPEKASAYPNGAISNSRTNGFQSKTYNNNNNKFPEFRSGESQKYSSYNIKKRILHMFAIRPHNMNDLLSRLLKEGISDTDKASIKDTLSILIKDYAKYRNSDTILMHLKPEYFKHVDLKWPLYSKTEIQLVRRNVDINSNIVANTVKGNDNQTNSDKKTIKSNVSEPFQHDFNKIKTINERDTKLQKIGDENIHESMPKAKKNSEGSESSSIQMPEKPQPLGKRFLESLNPSNLEKVDENYSALNINSNAKVPHNSAPDSKSANPDQLLLSKEDYDNYVCEYNEIFPNYKKLYDNVMIIREKFKSYHRKLKNIDVNDVDNCELVDLRQKINFEHDLINDNFQEDVNNLKKMHLRVTYLKKILTNHMERLKVPSN
ncbi:MAG: Cytochrome b-c1 complex subunit Rieske, mitochondrial [Marteilia pararefringens]